MNSNDKIRLLYIDLFCGAGGTSTGVHLARHGGDPCAKVIACVNHDANAIASHAANHPDALHYTEDIRTLELGPLAAHAARMRRQYPDAFVVLWASLECTNFSRAKGGLPRNADSRTLAEHLFRYIEALNPDYIQIENVEDLYRLIPRNSLDGVLFPNIKVAHQERDRLIRYCEQASLKTLVVPEMEELRGGEAKRSVREIRIEDLLGREEIHINLDEIGNLLEGKTVLVTGAAGSIGSEICRQLAHFPIKKLVCFDSAETPMHNLRLELEEKYRGLNFVPVIGDVRSPDRVDYMFRNWHPQVVFHAAAYKHVPLMEENPCEAIRTNVFGTRVMADAAVSYGVEKFVMISTDKAVNPTNIMGCSKRLAEIYVQSLSLAIERGEVKGETRFITTRFGNVLGSNGSVIPRFREQIAQGGPVTVTHPDIIRYFMTIPEACRLVLEAGTMGKGGEIFIFDMGEPVKIADLAKRMIELSGLQVDKDIEIKYTGLRPGEKLYEELLNNKENTKETPHEKIRVAAVREYDYKDVITHIHVLIELSLRVQILPMVKEMKAFVPEFKSQNSRFEELD